MKERLKAIFLIILALAVIFLVPYINVLRDKERNIGINVALGYVFAAICFINGVRIWRRR